MPGPLPAVRRVTAFDVPALTEALARAFADDPVLAWSCPRASRRVAVGRRFFGARLRQLLPEDEVWTTDDLAGTAVWAPPDRWRVSAWQTLQLVPSTLAALAPHRLPLVLSGLADVERRHPLEPHMYLAVLGTDPPAQGRGVGSAVLGPVLEDCDRNGVPAFLETGKERNVGFYARHGFRVTEEFDLPRGPRVWLMWRDPR